MFAFMFRVDGRIAHWGKTGVDFVRISPKTRMASADIFLMVSDWRDAIPSELRALIADYVGVAFVQMASRMRKKKLDFEMDRFLSDARNVVADFGAS